MKALRIGLIVCLLLSVVALALPSYASDNDGGPKFTPDRILVKFKDGVSISTKQKIHGKHGGQVIDAIEQIGVQVVKVPSGKALEKIKSYREEGVIEYAEPNYIVRLSATPNNPNDIDYASGKQWGLNNYGQIIGYKYVVKKGKLVLEPVYGAPDADIDAPEAWGETTGTASVKIAILDTGVDQDHIDLQDKTIDNVNFTSEDTRSPFACDDRYGHGTHVAGIAAAATNNSAGVAGVGYNCSIMNVKIFDDNANTTTQFIIDAITYAADNGAKVINMSFGSPFSNQAELNAVKYAWDKGVVLVASAGNSGNSRKQYPAGYDDYVIAVAATDWTDAKASFSTYGSWVDVAAPGTHIYSTLPNHNNHIGEINYGYLDGTSMASPHVAGLAGLVWSTNPNTDKSTVRTRIVSTADRIGKIFSKYHIPRINAYNAVVSTP